MHVLVQVTWTADESMAGLMIAGSQTLRDFSCLGEQDFDFAPWGACVRPE